MNSKRRALVRLLPFALGLSLTLPGAYGGQGVRPLEIAAGRVAVRSGDPAPVTVGLGTRFDSIATAPGGILFIDAAGTTLSLKAGDQVTSLVHAGQTAGTGVTIASVRSVAAGSDGTIAFLGLLSDGREGILRIGPERGQPEVVVMAEDSLDLRDGPATVGFLDPPVVDSGGVVVASIRFLEVPGAIVRFARGAPPEILIQTGDPLGTEVFDTPLAAPAAISEDRIAFLAMLQSGAGVVVSMAAGGTPVPLARFPPPIGPASPVLAPIPPAINASGQVAFFVVASGTLRAVRAGNGPTFVVAASGSAAPGTGKFTEITEFPSAIDKDGKVLFGALRSNGRHGFYLSDGVPTVLVEEGAPAGGAGSIARLETVPESGAAAALGSDGTLHVAATATAAAGIFAAAAGNAALEAASDEVMPSPRFVSFLDDRVPQGGGGPSLAPGGLMIFDARVTGGRRGLFVRDRSGTIRVVALDGDTAPGGGRFVGDRFAFHSINDGGTFAFLGEALDAGQAPALSLFYGALDDGTMRRIVDTESLPSPPGGGPPSAPGVGDRVKGAPSRLDRAGQIAVPVAQPDGTTVLMGFDGASLFRVAGPGDPAPGGGTFTNVFTGSLFTGQPVPPVLDDSGRVLFGATTSGGDSALYAGRLAPGGGGVPARVLGAGDEVEGGRLSPFELQAVDSREAGRIAFQAIYSDEFDFADFLEDDGPATRLAARFDPVLDRGFVMSVLPLLSVLDEGRIGYGVELFDGSEVILAADPGSGADPLILAASADPAPDGGTYLSFRAAPRNPGRLASDGRGSVALAASTTAGPEEIVLFGRSNAPPIADAGDDQVVECSGPEGARVALDGRASSDSDGDPLSFRWSGPFGEATGERPTVTLPQGASTITLVVDDGKATSEPDTVLVEVRDTIPPTIAIAATPSVLWPPDGRLVDVAVVVQVVDRCDPAPSVVLLGVTSSEPGGARPGDAIVGASPGSDDRSLSLRAARAGGGPGRTYVLAYRSKDASGNRADATTTVIVPHDQRHQ